MSLGYDGWALSGWLKMEVGHEFEGSVIVHMEEREEGWEEGQEGWKTRERKEGRVGGVFNNLLV